MHVVISEIITFCVITLCVRKVITICVERLLHFALKILLHFASILLHFALVLHFAVILHFAAIIKFIGTKESVYIRKEFNSYRTGLGDKHGCRFIVLEHKYGRHDVM